MTPLDQYFDELHEPMKSFMWALKDCVLRFDEDIVMTWKWKTPFFYYRDNMLAYLTIDRKSKRPYLGFLNGKLLRHPVLVGEGRKRIKVMYFSPDEDIAIDTLYNVLRECIGCE